LRILLEFTLVLDFDFDCLQCSNDFAQDSGNPFALNFITEFAFGVGLSAK